MAQPEFITKVACKLFPEVCLTGDFIVRYHEIADKMYFVQNGSFEVLATDHFTTIAFLGEGAYFGEIGVLITGKRSVSVKALSNCMTYAVKS
jgi:CRP-like cAMP-binding protein